MLIDGEADRPELHPFDPTSKRSNWPTACNPDTWPAFPAAPVGAHRIESTKSAIYRFYDENREALYVGVTTNPFHRWTPHRHTEWWPLIRYVAIEPVDPATRLVAEQVAIRTEKPRFNRTAYTTSKTVISFENGMPDVVAQLKRRMPPETFAELVQAFKAEPDSPSRPTTHLN